METIPSLNAAAVERQLDNLGMHLIGDWSLINWSRPVPMELLINDRSVHVAVLYLPEMSATTALQAAHVVPTDVPLLVVGPRVHGSSADTMRSRGIWHLDEAGNAYFRNRDFFVDIRGRRSAEHAAPIQRRKVGPANPFTPKRARVVFSLLTDHALVDAPFRDIAERSGVSLGMAKDTLDALELIGYVEQLGTHRRLIRREELLDLWAAAYPTGLGKTNVLIVASGDINNWAALGSVDTVISGEQALASAGLIRNPESLVVYLDDRGEQGPLRDLMVMNRWRRDPHGNITIRRLFWRNLEPMSGIGTAPPALVYADLLASNEPRQIEVARDMRRNDERLVQP